MRHRIKRSSVGKAGFLLALLATMAFVIAACGGDDDDDSDTASDGGGEVTEVAIGTQPWIGYGPFWIADEQGFDTDHGVDIKLVNFSTDQDLESGFASGKFQAANNANNTLIRLADLGLDYKIVLMEDVSLEADAVRLLQPRHPVDRGRRGRQGRVRGVLGLRRAVPLRAQRGRGRLRLDRLHADPGGRRRHRGGGRPGRRRGHLRAVSAGGGRGGRQLQDHLHRG